MFSGTLNLKLFLQIGSEVAMNLRDSATPLKHSAHYLRICCFHSYENLIQNPPRSPPLLSGVMSRGLCIITWIWILLEQCECYTRRAGLSKSVLSKTVLPFLHSEAYIVLHPQKDFFHPKDFFPENSKQCLLLSS